MTYNRSRWAPDSGSRTGKHIGAEEGCGVMTDTWLTRQLISCVDEVMVSAVHTPSSEMSSLRQPDVRCWRYHWWGCRGCGSDDALDEARGGIWAGVSSFPRRQNVQEVGPEWWPHELDNGVSITMTICYVISSTKCAAQHRSLKTLNVHALVCTLYFFTTTLYTVQHSSETTYKNIIWNITHKYVSVAECMAVIAEDVHYMMC